jgi:hypothetical protein
VLSSSRAIGLLVLCSVLAGCQTQLFSFERNDYARKGDVCVNWPKNMQPRNTTYAIDPYKALATINQVDRFLVPPQ